MKHTLPVVVATAFILVTANFGPAVSQNGANLASEETSLSTITRFPYQDSTRSISEAFPLVLANQTVLFVWADSTALRCSRSSDGGATWTAPIVVASPMRFANSLTGTRTSSGSLITFWRDSLGVRYTVSNDDGFTWALPIAFGTNANSLQLSQTSDGKLWLGMRPVLGASRFTTSTDNGTTWSAFQSLPTPQKEEIGFFSGQGNAVHCIYNPTSSGDIERITSTDAGVTWSAPVPILNSSNVERRPRIARQSNGVIWLLYDYRQVSTLSPPPFFGSEIQHIKSSDGGTSWSAPERFTRYVGNDAMNNVAMVNDKPFVTFSSDRWARGRITDILPTQIWYGIVGETPDVNPPPILIAASTYHQYYGLENWTRATVGDESGIATVTAQYYQNGFPYPSPFQMYDDGMHFDGRPNDNTWGTESVIFYTTDTLTCRFTITDVTGNTLRDVYGLGFRPSYPSSSSHVTQGSTMPVVFDGRGAFGKAVFPTNYVGFGMRYPASSIIEHLYGAGIWVGGKVDTTASGTGPRIKAVSTAYEGFSGPLFEFSPRFGSADSIWRVLGRNAPEPPNWSAYWGSALPFRAPADENFFNQYNDYTVRPTGHVPMGLNVIQSSYTWNDEEGIQILEFRIRNDYNRSIDSAYISFFADGDVGPVDTTNYFFNNYSAFLANPRTAYMHNPVNFGSTPFGVTVLNTHRPIDSLRFTFQWYPLSQSPINDNAKYDLISSGVIKPDEYPLLSDSRFLIAFGPFTIRPAEPPTRDTVRVAFALLSAMDVSQLQVRAARARNIYGGIVSVKEIEAAVPHEFVLAQNYPNPFNPTTEIKFSVETVGRTTLEVFNILGQRVATLFDDVAEPGRYYRMRFSGENLASGVYLYRLQSGKRNDLKKLLLLK